MRSSSTLLSSSLFALVALFGACVDVDTDPGERVGELPAIDGPTAEFDPASEIIPFPNNLLIDPSTGKVNLPAQCNETPAQTALRTMVLNTLDGFGTFKPGLQVTFTEPVDPASFEDHVLLYRIASGGTATDPATAESVPATTIAGVTARYSADCSTMTLVDDAVIVPLVPLDEKSTYIVAVTDGVTTASGEKIIPSVTWALVRQSQDPVTVENGVVVDARLPLDPVADAEQLLGLDMLWKANAPALQFLDAATETPRTDIVIAWTFNTQTTVDPLDPEVPSSLAADLPGQPLAGVTSIAGGNPEAFLQAALGVDTCALVGCDKVGDIVAAGFAAPNYQTRRPIAPGGPTVPGPWSDPVHPALQSTEKLVAMAFVPASKAPAAGYPTVVFGHGLTRSREDLVAIGSQLAAAGFASVAIDWVDSGSRAVQISSDASKGCAGTPDPTVAPQCFAPILSADLATTRDNIRQSALDALGLIGALQACGTDSCGALQVDGSRIGYLGQSLGGIIGVLVVAMSPDIQTAVINVGAVGWVDIFEHTDNLVIRCGIVDALIAAGVVKGEPGVTCQGQEWQQQPSYQQFANIARWVLDPADGANYLAFLGARPVLYQEVVGDQVVPNFATDEMTTLVGLSPMMADVATMAMQVSLAVTNDPMSSKWVRYETVPSGNGFPGNTYDHGSLLAPAADGAGGLLATGLMQADAITFLLSNL